MRDELSQISAHRPLNLVIPEFREITGGPRPSGCGSSPSALYGPETDLPHPLATALWPWVPQELCPCPDMRFTGISKTMEIYRYLPLHVVIWGFMIEAGSRFLKCYQQIKDTAFGVNSA